MLCSALLSSLGSAAVAVVMRVAMTVMMVMTAMVPVAAAFAAPLSAMAVVRCYTPEAMAAPSTFLALFGAVFCTTAATAFCELPCKFFPLAALPVSTLSDATTRIVFPAKVAHDYASPV